MLLPKDASLLTFVVVYAGQALGVDISRNLWVLALPIGSSLIINIALVELWDKFKRK